ncbi:unnamed protein product [Linum trigynum]|uniref:Uncharacterized protein n=1 Tax=Linum trigynum TaxID=586398 RepID=A0AAV2EQ02_9ROSI
MLRPPPIKPAFRSQSSLTRFLFQLDTGSAISPSCQLGQPDFANRTTRLQRGPLLAASQTRHPTRLTSRPTYFDKMRSPPPTNNLALLGLKDMNPTCAAQPSEAHASSLHVGTAQRKT